MNAITKVLPRCTVGLCEDRRHVVIEMAASDRRSGLMLDLDQARVVMVALDRALRLAQAPVLPKIRQ